jgi:GNAT superfamily N-acetyltransferase
MALAKKQSATNFLNPGGDIKTAINFALGDPFRNAFIISNLTQLKNDCSLVIKQSASGDPIAASLYKDLPFNAVALMVETAKDLNWLLAELASKNTQLRDKPVYGLYNTKTTMLIEKCFKVTEMTPEVKMTIGNIEIPEIDYDDNLYRLERLTIQDIVQISHLYGLVPSMAWTPRALALGPYFGVYHDEHLVSIAGVHFAIEAVAEIGNIVTHFKHRRQNLAYLCTKAVVDSLRNSCENIFLCVFADNESAIRLYEKMGFVKSEDLYLVQYYI